VIRGGPQRGVLLWSDTGQERTLNYRTMYEPRNEEIAAGTGRFVLNAVAEDPKAIPDP
jgi:hypothetical protein